VSSPTPYVSRALTCAVVVALLVVGLTGPAGAAPSGSSGAGSAGTGATSKPVNLDALNEQYNLARLRLAQATAAVQATDARVAAIRARADEVRDAVRARSARLYQGAGGDAVSSILSISSVGELSRRTQYYGAAAKEDRTLLRDLSKTLDQLAAMRASQHDAETRLRAEADAAAAMRRKLLAEAAAAAARNKAQRDAAGPVGTPKVMRATSSMSGTNAPPAPIGTPAPARPAPAPSTRQPSAPPPSAGPSYPPAPPASGRGGQAVAFARAQLGKPYVFAAAGPDSFDCSGLTMAAWRSAGVSMDHYSGSQAASFPKVGWNQLQPGDILVFYPDFHHVGLYIGGGQMIHAPHTGDVVRIADAWRTEFQFGVRPG
jgi:peptidoglycan DL-endopeptidase CwlO